MGEYAGTAAFGTSPNRATPATGATTCPTCAAAANVRVARDAHEHAGRPAKAGAVIDSSALGADHRRIIERATTPP